MEAETWRFLVFSHTVLAYSLAAARVEEEIPLFTSTPPPSLNAFSKRTVHNAFKNLLLGLGRLRCAFSPNNGFSCLEVSELLGGKCQADKQEPRSNAPEDAVPSTYILEYLRALFHRKKNSIQQTYFTLFVTLKSFIVAENVAR